MLSRDEITARSLRLSGRSPNPYTGTANDPFQEAQSRYAGPGWEQFFGGLQKTEEDAYDQGKNYRVNWGGFGDGGDNGGSVGGRRFSLARGDGSDLNPLEQQAQKYFLLQRQADDAVEQAKAERAAQKAYGDAETDRVNGRLAKSYEDFSLSSAFVPANRITRTPGVVGPQLPGSKAKQNPTYEAKPAGPMDARQALLQSVPGHLRPSLEAQLAAFDLKRQAADLDKSKLQETARHNAAMEKAGAGAGDDVALAVGGMKDGSIPPQLPGRASKDYIKILSEAKRQGYDLAGAATDWTATQKHIATMNGAQQLRLNQAINALPDMLDKVDALASQWKGGKFPILNKANLALAKGGAYGSDVASVANQLDAQIADVTADLGNVYMGGNSPTDHALSLAGKSLKSDWDEKVLRDMVTLAKENVTIRRNSIRNTGVAGASERNPYGNQPAAASTGGGTVKLLAPDGKSTRDVPADQVDHYLKLGAKRVGS